MDFIKNDSLSLKQSATKHDEGLRIFFLNIYKYMFIALLLTGVVAFGASTSPQLMRLIYTTPLQWVVMFAPLVMVFFIMPKLMDMSHQAAQLTFWAFSALMGLSLSYIFLVYTGESIVRVFFITSATFGAMSLYGYTTKRDLTGMGSFLMMGVFGLIIASVVNIFLKSTAMEFMISLLGVGIFIGLIAYDTQRLKRMYFQIANSGDMIARMAIFGALALYLDFINLFIMLLRLMGNRR